MVDQVGLYKRQLVDNDPTKIDILNNDSSKDTDVTVIDEDVDTKY